MRYLLTLILILSVRVHADCAGDLKSNLTQDFLAYLSSLVAENEIPERALITLRDELIATQTFANPLAQATKLSAVIHRKAIEEYIQSGQLDLDQIMRWTNEVLEKQTREAASREGRKDKTTSLLVEMKFLPVRPGKVGDARLLQRIEVMQTLVTQKMWAELMHTNLSHFRTGPESISMTFAGRTLELQPNHPVENVNWYDAAKFANRLSEISGLPPTYDFSLIEEYMATPPAERIGRHPPILINAPEGDIYRAKGYRLPTATEVVYLLSGLGKSTDNYFPGVDEDNLFEFAWMGAKSEETSHPVAALRPFVIEGQPFYDLLGNVQIWTSDAVDEEDEVFAGVNPYKSHLGPNAGHAYVSSAGFFHDLNLMEYSLLSKRALYNSYRSIGLRLVRTLE